MYLYETLIYAIWSSWSIRFIANRCRIPFHQINLCPLLTLSRESDSYKRRAAEDQTSIHTAENVSVTVLSLCTNWVRLPSSHGWRSEDELESLGGKAFSDNA